MDTYKTLKMLPVNGIRTIEKPDTVDPLDLESPATSIFTDFRDFTPIVLEQNTPIDVALELMKRTHVKLKLVIDAQESLKGVISLADLLSVKVMRAIETTGLSREDLTVAHVMTRREQLHAIQVADLEHARVGDLLTTMKSFGEQHVLVIDSQRQIIRGLISATDIARRLHIAIAINARANSFAEVYEAVAS